MEESAIGTDTTFFGLGYMYLYILAQYRLGRQPSIPTNISILCKQSKNPPQVVLKSGLCLGNEQTHIHCGDPTYVKMRVHCKAHRASHLYIRHFTNVYGLVIPSCLRIRTHTYSQTALDCIGVPTVWCKGPVAVYGPVAAER